MGRIVRGASRPGGDPPGQDRWTATARGVVVLDGASAFDSAAPTADAYVDALLPALARRLDTEADISSVLRDAIAEAAERLRLEPGAAPSSTVVLLREIGDCLEIAVLGDSTAVVGFRDGRTDRLTDSRISLIAAPERRRYRGRLHNGHGYDSTHREILGRIQRSERAARNAEPGYWIAEADPAAGEHAVIRRYRASDVAWCVLATDGAQRGFDHQAIDWTTLHTQTERDLRRLLDDLQQWETDRDPDGAALPRAKRHDDKTVVVWSAREAATPPVAVHSVSVAGVVVRDDGRVLVAQRRDNGRWEAPGGVLERDETFEAGVRREVVEETGVVVEVERLTGAYKNLTRCVVALVFRCRPVAGEPTPTAEAQQVRWMTPDEVTAHMAPAFAIRVLDALGNHAASRAHDGMRLIAP
jgi:8-oxo-dGTP pyrophosphatase MutT (NUDIX family)